MKGNTRLANSLIVSIALSLFSTNVISVTAQELVQEYSKIMVYCGKKGFYICEKDKFEGDFRGAFLKPIGLQNLAIMEKRYKEFVNQQYGNGINISFFKLTASLDFSKVPRFSMKPFTPKNIKKIQPMNKKGTIFKFMFKKAPPLALVNKNGVYKLAIFPEQEKQQMKTKQYKTGYIAGLKANILRYHMFEAKFLKLSKEKLREDVNHAIAPIVEKTIKGEVPAFVKKFIKRSFKEVRQFYTPLNTDQKAIARIKQIHNI